MTVRVKSSKHSQGIAFPFAIVAQLENSSQLPQSRTAKEDSVPLCLPALVLLPCCARSQRLTALYCRALYPCRGPYHKCVDSPANRPHTGPVNIDSSGANTPWPAFPNQRARHSAQGTWGNRAFFMSGRAGAYKNHFWV